MRTQNTGRIDADNTGGKAKRTMPRFTEVLKYVVLAAIIAYIVLLMIYTSGSTKPYSEIEKAVEAALDTENLEKADTQGLKRYYGLNGADYEGVMLYTSKASLSAEEVLLIKVENEGQMQHVKDAVQKRLDSRKNDFEGYAPKESQMIAEAQLSVRGKYLFLAVAPKAEKYKEVFAKSL